MNILFVHQSFPGQYRHILRHLAQSSDHCIVGLGVTRLTEQLPTGVQYYQYPLHRGNTSGLHEWLVDFDSKLIRGEACAAFAKSLKDQGFTPDIICAHSGWGEALFLKYIWPNSPLLCYQEFFYNECGFDSNFDSEFQDPPSWRDSAKLKIKNTNALLMLETSNWNVTPTQFQKSSFPTQFHDSISIIHDGIDTNLCQPIPYPLPITLSDGTLLDSDSQVITFVNRTLEPYRGCHSFIRSIPLIQQELPTAHIVIIGATTGISYGKAHPSGSWSDIFLQEIDGSYNKNFVHFTGSLEYADYLKIMALSSCNVYLTYPFVLSWSMLESMSFGIPVVASNTLPVAEVIRDGENGILVDFFSPSDITHAIARVLNDNDLSSMLSANARTTILEKYSLTECVSDQISLIELIAKGCIGA